MIYLICSIRTLAIISSYTYNGDGLRSSKVHNSTTYTYYYNGTQLAMQKWENKSLHFIYDEGGSPYAVIYNNGTSEEVYYYIRNQQGDIIMIADKHMNITAKYAYDAWGKLLYVKNNSGSNITDANHIANVNPIRYRGYYYDTETSFYYLESRYYDPAVGRFLNADNIDIVRTTTNLTDKNLFAYCDNNPVMRFDDGGDFWNVLIGAVVGGAISALSYAVSNQGNIDPWGMAIAIGVGATSGAICATGKCVVASLLVGAYSFFTTDGNFIQKSICAISSGIYTYVGGNLSYGLTESLNTLSLPAQIIGNVFVDYSIGQMTEFASLGTQSLVTYSNNSNSKRNSKKTPTNNSTSRNSNVKTNTRDSNRNVPKKNDHTIRHRRTGIQE